MDLKTLIIPPCPLLKEHLSLKSLQQKMSCFLVGSYLCLLFCVSLSTSKQSPIQAWSEQTPAREAEGVGPLTCRRPAPAGPPTSWLSFHCCRQVLGGWLRLFRTCLHFSALGGLCHLHFPLLARLLLPCGCSLTQVSRVFACHLLCPNYLAEFQFCFWKAQVFAKSC